MLLTFQFSAQAQNDLDVESLGLDIVDNNDKKIVPALPIIPLPQIDDKKAAKKEIKKPKIIAKQPAKVLPKINNQIPVIPNQKQVKKAIAKKEDNKKEVVKNTTPNSPKPYIKTKDGKILKTNKAIVKISKKQEETKPENILNYDEENRIKDLNDLRKKYLIKIETNIRPQQKNIITPTRKITNPFISEDLPAPPILDSYRTADNNHIPIFLSLDKRIKQIFDAITNGDVAYFNSAYNVVKKPNLQNELGDTLLTYAILMQKYAIISSLIAKGSDVNEANKLGYTPIDIAIELKDAKTFRILAKSGADLNYVDNFGRTYLFHASRLGFLEAVEILVRNNIDINALDKDGMSALNFAYKNKQDIVIKYLLANGAKSWLEKPFDNSKKSLIEELENRWD